MLLQKWEEMLKDGFMETGDVMEQRGPNTVVWIDRKKNIMKLSQVTTLLFWRNSRLISCHSGPVRLWSQTPSASAELWHDSAFPGFEANKRSALHAG